MDEVEIPRIADELRKKAKKILESNPMISKMKSEVLKEIDEAASRGHHQAYVAVTDSIGFSKSVYLDAAESVVAWATKEGLIISYELNESNKSYVVGFKVSWRE